jgi:hypothetical protein
MSWKELPDTYCETAVLEVDLRRGFWKRGDKMMGGNDLMMPWFW